MQGPQSSVWAARVHCNVSRSAMVCKVKQGQNSAEIQYIIIVLIQCKCVIVKSDLPSDYNEN